jgi:hypothetical protein
MRSQLRFLVEWWSGDNQYLAWIRQEDLWTCSGKAFKIIKIMEV